LGGRFDVCCLLPSNVPQKLTVSISSSNVTLANGGMAGGVWMFLIVAIGMFFCMLSMAEMASMAPTAGGQYHCKDIFLH